MDKQIQPGWNAHYKMIQMLHILLILLIIICITKYFV
jgi:hypothetical protein